LQIVDVLIDYFLIRLHTYISMFLKTNHHNNIFKL
jgi:hypothetical protein